MKIKALMKTLRTLDPEADFKFQLSDEIDNTYTGGENLYLEEVRVSVLTLRNEDSGKELDNFFLEKEPVKLILV